MTPAAYGPASGRRRSRPRGASSGVRRSPVPVAGGSRPRRSADAQLTPQPIVRPDRRRRARPRTADSEATAGPVAHAVSARPGRRRRARSPAERAGVAVGDELIAIDGAGAARRHRVPGAHRRGRGRRSTSPGRPRAVGRGRQGRGRAARASRCSPRCSTRCARATTTASSASSTSCPRAAASLYLKDDDYRLSFLYGNFTTLTRFTEADLERVITERPVAAERQHPRHRSRRARRHAAQPPRRDEPAVAAGAARPRRRGPRPGRRVPRASTTAPCSTTRSPACSTSTPSWPTLVRRAARREPSTTPSRACGPHRRPRPRPSSTPSTTGRTCSSTALGRRLVVRRRRVLPAGRAAVPGGRRRTRASPMHEDGIGMARTFELEFAGDADDGIGVQAGFFAWVDGAADGYRAPTGRATSRTAGRAATRRRSWLQSRRAAPRAGRHPHRAVRRRGCSRRSSSPRSRRRARHPGRQPVLRRQHRASPG